MTEHTHYIFLPWFRKGLATQITIPDAEPGPEGKRVTLPLSLKVNDENILVGTDSSFPSVELYGPGDVTGFSQNMVVRTEPRNHVGDFEPNIFPSIEFYEADFPWRFTPASSTESETRLRPWICLIVLKAPGEETEEEPEYTPGIYDPQTSQPFITIHNLKKSLPDLAYSWAWTHAQVTHNKPQIEQEELNDLIRLQPERVLSRLLCPRRLEPGQLYHAFVVPTFESGRLAGLGRDIPPDQSLLQAAWTLQEESIDLPFYYKWEFRTGMRGDFETLVRLLKPRSLDPRVGTRFMNCSRPGFNVSSVKIAYPPIGHPDYALGLEGALMALDSKPSPWPENSGDSVQTELEELLNLPENLIQGNSDDPMIVPPIYGRWHAAKNEIKPDNPKWLNTLNLDPRHRVASGFGTQVIRDHQEHLMAEAWRQVGDIEEANALLKGGQLAQAVTQRIYQQRLAKMPRETLIRMTSSLHSRVLVETDNPGRISLQRQLETSPLPRGIFSKAFHRMTRPRGVIRKRQKKFPAGRPPALLARANAKQIFAADSAPEPQNHLRFDKVSEKLRPPPTRLWLWAIFSFLPRFILRIIAWLFGQRWISDALNAERFQEKNFSPDSIAATPVGVGFKLTEPGSAETPVGSEQNADAQTARFKKFAIEVQKFVQESSRSTVKLPTLKLDQVQQNLLKELDPSKTVRDRIMKRVTPPNGKAKSNRLEPILHGPEFNRPMYEPLRDISQELLLPGLQYVSQNTISLLKSNQEFIEAYMVGLNHEMGRELLWREFPTDQRGSYFRQFWDTRTLVFPKDREDEIRELIQQELQVELADLVNEEKETRIQEELDSRIKEMLKDIKPIHLWKNTDLGENANRNDQELEDKVVLIVRGDVLKKYPTAAIYAARGTWESEGRKPLLDQSDENTRSPIFTGTLPPDITFIGFDLTEEKVRGSVIREDSDPGWFFVIEERLSEARFGLDAHLGTEAPVTLENWNELSWGHIVENLSEAGYIDGLQPPEPNDPGEVDWESHSGNLAKITFNKPVRIAVHADDMMPKGNPAETEPVSE